MVWLIIAEGVVPTTSRLRSCLRPPADTKRTPTNEIARPMIVVAILPPTPEAMCRPNNTVSHPGRYYGDADHFH